MRALPLNQMMTKPVLSLPAETAVAEALEIMGNRRISCILVTEAGLPVGIVTEKDIIKSYAGVRGHAKAAVADIMSHGLVTLPEDTDHFDAFRLMVARRIRHLAIASADGTIVGVVTETDFIRHLGADYYVKLKDAASAMAPATTLAETAPLSLVLARLTMPEAACIIIERDGVATGIVTERDIVRLLRQDVDPTTLVGTVMTTPVHTVDIRCSLLQASDLLRSLKLRRLVVVDGDGRTRGVLGEHEILRGLEGEYVSYLEGLIAEKDHACSALRQAKATVDDQAARLERTVLELSHAHAELCQFHDVAAHDLQEPARTVVSFAQLLLRDYTQVLDVRGRDYLNFIVGGAQRMRAHVRDLLAYSDVDNRGATRRVTNADASRAAIDANEAAQAALTALAPLLAGSGVTVLLDALPMVQARRAPLIEVFAELISNAVKFRRPGSPLTVRIAAVADGGFWRFTIADDGPGIDKAYHEQVFTLFRRLQPASAQSGSGVGLPICRRIVETFGGRIWIVPNAPAGSVFCFTLPAVAFTGGND